MAQNIPFMNSTHQSGLFCQTFACQPLACQDIGLSRHWPVMTLAFQDVLPCQTKILHPGWTKVGKNDKLLGLALKKVEEFRLEHLTKILQPTCFNRF